MNSGRKKSKIQGKKPSHREAVIRSLLIELVRNGKLQTTPNKARILKSEFDRLVGEAKKDTPASRRRVEQKLNEKSAIKLYSKILPQVSDLNSGYTVSARALPRKGDNADQMIVMIKGHKVEERKSRLSAALQRRDKSDDPEKGGEGIRGRIQKVAGGGRGRKHESVETVRRVST